VHYGPSLRWLPRPHSTGSVPSLLWVRREGGLILGACLCCLVSPLAAQRRGTMMVEATVLPAAGTQTFQQVGQLLRPLQTSGFSAVSPAPPQSLATISIDSVALAPGAASRRIVVNVEYLRN